MALLKLARVLPLALFVLTLMPVTGANAQHFIKPRFKPPVEAEEEKFKISGRVVDKKRAASQWLQRAALGAQWCSIYVLQKSQ
ncbi:MAG: hypothetical protein IPP57_06860 [Candidatus Obscuribacter sp.]|nr:hypothetical protein [Candidatus Obscuribacter sp.]